MTMKKRLLLIGAGPTSSLLAFNIKNSLELKDYFEVTIWEKSKQIGGRFNTFQGLRNPKCLADLGAQYLTFSGQDFSKPYFENLVHYKLLKKIDTTNIPGFHHDSHKTNYVCTQGAASIVKHFFNQSGESTFCLNKEANGIFPSSNENSVTVKAVNSESEKFDFVISTIPVPQLLEFHNINIILKDKEETKAKLQNISYTSRFALGFYYDDPKGPFEELGTFSPFNFASDPMIRYWSIENLKRSWPSKSPTEPCAIVVHTSVNFAAEYLEKSSEEIKESLVEKVRGCIPSLRNQTAEEVVINHKWRYSQVETPYPEMPGFVEITRNVLATGDGFSRSGFEGCVIAAQKTLEYLETVMA